MLHRFILASIAGVFIAAIYFVLRAPTPEYDAAGTARRPLVIISGNTQQLPTADYVSTAGGLSTNATAAAAGDVQTTTLATGALNVGATTVAIPDTTVNDWNPTGLQTNKVFIVTLAGQTVMTGITAPTGNVGGRELCIKTSGTSSLTFNHQSSSSSAANRFILATGNPWQLPGNTDQSVCFAYDGTAQRWIQIAASPYFPKLNAGSSGQFAVATTGAVSGTTMALLGRTNQQSATTSGFTIGGTAPFVTDVTPMSYYGINADVAATRSSGTAALTNVAIRANAQATAQAAVAIEADTGDVILNKTAGYVTKIGATPQIISTATPSVNNGSLGTGSTNWVGNVTGVGANTSVTLTFSAAFTNRSWCFAQPNATGQAIYVTNSASAPVFSCIDMAGVAANCVDFSYHCVGQ